ncbi:serine/threonine-protein kinase pim-1-like [Silurus meridionalis]|nr:serine/threonine-protein kinase pim-1-like [Silurus meridionalis]
MFRHQYQMLPWKRDVFSLLDNDICWMRYFGQEGNKIENKAPSAVMIHKKFLYINQHTGSWNIKDRAHDQPKSSFRGKRKPDNLPNEYEPHQKRQKKQIIEEKTDVSKKTNLVLYINQHTGSWNIKKRAYDQPKSSFRGKRKPDILPNDYEPHQKRQKKQIIEEKTDVSNTNKLPPKHLGIAHLLEVYETRELLGKGGFGSVYAGVRKADGLPVAIKYISKRKAPKKLEIPGHGFLPTEVALMSIVNTEPYCLNILRILEWYEQPKCYYIVLERPEPCENLHQFCSRYGSCLPETVARLVMVQLIDALKHCKSRGILHRDVKPENIMVQTNTLKVKLIDFGCGDLIKDKYKEFTGTPSYAPPEWFKKKKYLAEPATVWSVGVTLYRLVCGSLPFNTRKDVKHGHVRFSRSHSEECMHLIRWCLCTKPAGRPSLEQIEHHPWFHFKGSALQTTG